MLVISWIRGCERDIHYGRPNLRRDYLLTALDEDANCGGYATDGFGPRKLSSLSGLSWFWLGWADPGAGLLTRAPFVTSWLGPRNLLPDGAGAAAATTPGHIWGFSSHSIAALFPGMAPFARCGTGQAAPGLFPLAIAPPGFSLSVSIAFCARAAPCDWWFNGSINYKFQKWMMILTNLSKFQSKT